MMVCLLTKKARQVIFGNKRTFLLYLYYFILLRVYYKSVILSTPARKESNQTPDGNSRNSAKREAEAANVNKMAAFHGSCFPKDLLSSLSAEVLYIILSYLPAKSLLNLSECNRRLRDLCQNCNSLWKHLCKVSCDSFDQEIKLIDKFYDLVHLGSEEIIFFLTILYHRYNDARICFHFVQIQTCFSSCLLMGMF